MKACHLNWLPDSDIQWCYQYLSLHSTNAGNGYRQSKLEIGMTCYLNHKSHAVVRCQIQSSSRGFCAGVRGSCQAPECFRSSSKAKFEYCFVAHGNCVLSDWLGQDVVATAWFEPKSSISFGSSECSPRNFIGHYPDTGCFFLLVLNPAVKPVQMNTFKNEGKREPIFRMSKTLTAK